jgi:hypothetical protein
VGMFLHKIQHSAQEKQNRAEEKFFIFPFLPIDLIGNAWYYHLAKTQ